MKKHGPVGSPGKLPESVRYKIYCKKQTQFDFISFLKNTFGTAKAVRKHLK